MLRCLPVLSSQQYYQIAITLLKNLVVVLHKDKVDNMLHKFYVCLQMVSHWAVGGCSSGCDGGRWSQCTALTPRYGRRCYHNTVASWAATAHGGRINKDIRFNSVSLKL